MLIKIRKKWGKKVFYRGKLLTKLCGKEYAALEQKKPSVAMRQKEKCPNGSHVKGFCLKKKRRLLKCNGNEKKNEIFRNKLNQGYERLVC